MKANPPVVCSPGKKSLNGSWVLDDGRSSLVDSKFARTIAAKSRGTWDNPKKMYKPFKVVFFDEEQHNPSLANAHISNEFEAQLNESARHLQSSGITFTKETRFALESNGPQKPERVPFVFDKPQKVFGRARQIRPFARAQVYTRPVDRCNPPSSKLTEYIEPGPGTYDPHKDLWSEKSQPVCGSLRLSSSFMSPSRTSLSSDSALPETIFLTRPEPKNPSKLRNMFVPSDSSIAASSANEEFRRFGGSTSCGQIFEMSSSFAAGTNGVSQSSSHASSQTKWTSGRTFPKAPLGKSSLDIDTGSTNADKHFRRVRLQDGSAAIISICPSQGVLDPPEGSTFETAWATSHYSAKDDQALQFLASPVTIRRMQHHGRALPQLGLSQSLSQLSTSAVLISSQERPGASLDAVGNPHGLPSALSSGSKPWTAPEAGEWRPPIVLETKRKMRQLSDAKEIKEGNAVQLGSSLEGADAALKSRSTSYDRLMSPATRAALPVRIADIVAMKDRPKPPVEIDATFITTHQNLGKGSVLALRTDIMGAARPSCVSQAKVDLATRQSLDLLHAIDQFTDASDFSTLGSQK